MDMQKIAREIGLFETAINLSKVCESQDVILRVGESIPVPDRNIDDRLDKAAEWLCGFEKKKYFFLTPEIALIDAIGEKTNGKAEIIIAVPCDMERECEERLKNNLPSNMNAVLWEEPFFLQSFYPGNGIMVVCGYLGNDRAMVMSDTYRLIEHYSGFHGRKVFLPYTEMEVASRYNGWMEVGQGRLTDKWRYEA